MAANSKSTVIAKRVATQIWSSNSPGLAQPSLSFLRRSVHAAVYDKNQADLAQPNTVPDEVIEPQSDKYWTPHPKTGVFGPLAANNQNRLHSSSATGEQSVMEEEKAWFRPTSLEDLEKPV